MNNQDPRIDIANLNNINNYDTLREEIGSNDPLYPSGNSPDKLIHRDNYTSTFKHNKKSAPKSPKNKRYQDLPVFHPKNLKDEEILDIYVQDYIKAPPKIKTQKSKVNLQYNPYPQVHQRAATSSNVNLNHDGLGSRSQLRNHYSNYVQDWKQIGMHTAQIQLQILEEDKYQNQVNYYQKIQELQDQIRDDLDRNEDGEENVDQLLGDAANDPNAQMIYKPAKPEQEVAAVAAQPQSEPSKDKEKEVIDQANKVDAQDEDYEKKQMQLMGLDQLIYGNLITLNIDGMNQNKRTTHTIHSKTSISPEPAIQEYEKGVTETKCLFRIIPQSQFAAQHVMSQQISEATFESGNIQKGYDSLMAECEANKTYQQQVMGVAVKYWADVQIIHEDTKRFLAVDKDDSGVNISKLYHPVKFQDTFVKKVCFSSLSEQYTHFKLVPSCTFQAKGSGLISSGHYFYLMYTTEDNKELYLYNYYEGDDNLNEPIKNQQFILTESYKTPFKFVLQRETVTLDEGMSLKNSNIVFLSMANEKLYLNHKTHAENQIKNSQQEQKMLMRMSTKKSISTGFLEENQEKQEKQLQLEEYEDPRDVDLNGYWIPVNQYVKELTDLESQAVFKMRTMYKNGDDPENLDALYVQVTESRENIDEKKVEQQLVTYESLQNTKYLQLGSKIKFNQTDTFTFLFPDANEILEIHFCADTILTLKVILDNLKKKIGDSNKSTIYTEEDLNVQLTRNLFDGVRKYCTNELSGMILKKHDQGEPIPTRQDILKRSGILECIFQYLQCISDFYDKRLKAPTVTKDQQAQEQQYWTSKIIEFFHLEEKQSDENIFEIIFDLLYNTIQNKKTSKIIALNKIDLLKKFIFIKNVPKLIISILKEKGGVEQKHEIHSSSEPTKIYSLQKYVTILDFLFQNLQSSSKKHTDLYMIRKFCVQNGCPLPLVQNYVHEFLFKKNDGILFTSKMTETDVQIMTNTQANSKPKQLSAIIESMDHFPEEPSREVMDDVNDAMFFNEQLSLMASLCYGRNEKAIETMTALFPLADFMKALKLTTITNKYKAKFMKILINCYVDISPNDEQRLNRLIIITNDDDERIGDQSRQDQTNVNNDSKTQLNLKSRSKTPGQEIPSTNNKEIYTFLILFFEKQLKDRLPYIKPKEDEKITIQKEQKNIVLLDLEVLKLANFMLRFKLYQEFENPKAKGGSKFVLLFVNFIFLMLLRFAKAQKSYNLISDTDKFLTLSQQKQNGIIDENSLFQDDKFNLNNPIDRSALELKYKLFNKKFWLHAKKDEELQNKSKAVNDVHDDETSLHYDEQIKAYSVDKIIEILHYIQDVRQSQFLMHFRSFIETQRISKEEPLEYKLENVKNLLPSQIALNPNQAKDIYYSIEVAFQKFLEGNKISIKDYIQRKCENFLDLLIDVFNNCLDNSFLQQMTLSYVIRCHNENADFLRNIAKGFLIQDKKQENMAKAIEFQIGHLESQLQQSNLIHNSDEITAGMRNDYKELLITLEKFEQFMQFECMTIGEDNFTKANEYQKNIKVQKFAQDLFRALKGYDVILDYISQNKKVFIEIQLKQKSTNKEAMLKASVQLQPGDIQLNKNGDEMIRDIFKKCFNVLFAFTQDNKKNQSLMWKYKEQFVFPKLKDIPQIGELDFVKAILQKNDKIKFTRNLDQFVQRINQRLDNKGKNAIAILQIYKNLIVSHDFPFIKKAVFLAIYNSQQYIQHKKPFESRYSFETFNEVLGILAILLKHDSNGKSKEIMKRYFNLENFIEIKNGALTNINIYSSNKEYSFEKAEVVKDSFLQNISAIYSTLFFKGTSFSFDEILKLQKFYREQFKNDITSQQARLQQIMDSTNANIDAISISELKYCVTYCNKYFIKPMDAILSTHKQQNYFNKLQIHMSQKMSDQNSAQLSIQENLNLFEKHIADYELGHPTLKKRLFLRKGSVEINEQELVEAKQEHEEEKINNEIEGGVRQETAPSFEPQIKMSNAFKSRFGKLVQSQQDKKLQELRTQYEVYIKDNFYKNEELRQYVDSQEDYLAENIYTRLVRKIKKKNHQEVRELKFIYNLIQHLEKCEKMPWTIHNFIFGLNVLRRIQSKASQLKEDNEDEKEAKNFIVAIFDSQLNFTMFINIFNQASDFLSKAFFNELVLSSVFNYMFPIKPDSQQKRFLQYFTPNNTSEQFFRFIYQSFEQCIDKIKNKSEDKGYLIKKYKTRNSPHHFSNKIYNSKKFLEQDLVNLLRLMLQNPSDDMKRILRNQAQNNRSYNLLLIVYKYAYCLSSYMRENEIVYDQVLQCLDFLNDAIQGPNFKNQQVLIDNGFLPFVKEVLEVILIHNYYVQIKYTMEPNRQPIWRKLTCFKLKNTAGTLVRKNSKNSTVMPVDGAQDLPSLNRAPSPLKNAPKAELSKTLKGNTVVAQSKYQPAFEKENFKVSKLKLLVTKILFNMTQGHKVDSDIFLQIRRELQPLNFRQVFSEFSFFFQNYENSEYKNDRLFSYQGEQKNPDQPYIIEIAFFTFFVLKQIQESMGNDGDDYYMRNIISLIPDEKKAAADQIVIFAKLKLFAEGYLKFIWDSFVIIPITFMTKLCTRKNKMINTLDSNDEITKTLKFLDQNSSRIELVKEGGEMQKVFFIKLPFCEFHSGDYKENFLMDVDRSTTKTKAEGLMKHHERFYRYLKRDYLIRQRFIIGYFAKYLVTWEISSFLLSCFINILILFSYEALSTDEQDEHFKIELFGVLSQRATTAILAFAAYIILINNAVIAIIQVFSKIPLYYEFAFRIDKYEEDSFDDEDPLQRQGFKNFKKKASLLGRKVWSFIYKIFSDFMFLYHLVCLVYAILGVTKHYFFFAFHLSYIVISSPTLKNVLRALWEPKDKILLSFLFFIICEYGFAVIGFYVYRSYFPQYNCISLTRCFITMLDQTFKAGGGVGGYMDHAYNWDSNPLTGDTMGEREIYYLRILYDNAFNFVLLLLIIQMVTGIIVDKFGALREKDEEIEKDSQTICFICGRQREEIDKELSSNTGFQKHIQFSHNMWDYIYFTSFLYEKRKKLFADFNDLENYVFNKLETEQYTWLPAHQQDIIKQNLSYSDYENQAQAL